MLASQPLSSSRTRGARSGTQGPPALRLRQGVVLRPSWVPAPGSASAEMTARVGAVLAALLLTAAASNDPAERLRDPAQETRARHLFQEVRCLVCQNESIDDSEADLAEDLRRVVRAQVQAGRSDTDIRRFLTDRYGDFVLLRPPFSLGNAALWLTPFAIVLGGGSVLMFRRRTRSPPPTDDTLSEDERERLDRLTAPSPATQP